MEMCAAFYAHLLTLVPGTTSINELRVFTAIGLATFRDEHVGITELSNQLGIPLSTMSRLVTKLSDEGNVIAIKHPRDDRRRTLRFSPRHLESVSDWTQRWISIREQLAEFPRRPTSQRPGLTGGSLVAAADKTIDEGAEHATKNGGKPEQPQLRDGPVADVKRNAGTARGIHRGVRDRNADQVN